MHRHPHPCPHTQTFCTHIYHGFTQTRMQEHCHLLHPHILTPHTAATDTYLQTLAHILMLRSTQAPYVCKLHCTSQSHSCTHTPHCYGVPTPTPPPRSSSPTVQTRTTTQRQRKGRAQGLCPERNISGGSVPRCSVLQARGGGGGGCTEQSPPLAASPRLLAGTSERGAQVTETIRGYARPCWPPSFLPSQHPGLTGEGRMLFALLPRT